jgi:hypothetical protein
LRRNLALAFVAFFAATTAFSQNPLNGKWATVRPAALEPFQKWENVQLELQIEGATASGTLALGGLGGTFIVLKNGIVFDKRVQFRYHPVPDTTTVYTIDLLDENTVTVFQSLPEISLVGNNVLSLISVLPGFQAVPPTPPTAPRPPSSALLSGVTQDQSRALIPGVTVTLIQVDTGETFKTVTDEAGRYEFPGDLKGRYRLTASLPGFRTTTINDLSIGNAQSKQDLTLEVDGAAALARGDIGPRGDLTGPALVTFPAPAIPEARPAAPAALTARERDPQKGTATGTIRGPDGRPAAGVRVAAVTPPETPGDRASTSMSAQTETDEQGRFVLDGIPPGRYLIAAGRVDNPTYLPGTRDLARATVFTVAAGMSLTDLNISTTDISERPVGSSGLMTSASAPVSGPCDPNNARCKVLRRVK